jgi:two-component system cell cycle sensor histidine kinase/response regulator CckA
MLGGVQHLQRSRQQRFNASGDDKRVPSTHGQAKAGSSTTLPLRGLRVLVVEEDPASAKLLNVLLSVEGAHVKTVYNAEEAAIAVETFNPHVIVLELVLPFMSGLLFAQRLKSNPETRDILIVAVTAFNGPETERVTRNAGCAVYVRKPRERQRMSPTNYTQAKDARTSGAVSTPVWPSAHAPVSDSRYRSLLERIPDVIWTARADGTVTWITPNVADMLGYTPEEICAEDLEARLARVHPDDQARAREAFARAAVSGDATFEYRRRHKAGHWVWLRNRTIGSYQCGAESYCEGMLTDISEQKRLEDSLRQAQKMEAVARLTGGIAHDFNNILAAILANAHLLLEDLPAQDPRRLEAEEIKRAAERGGALTRQLLAFSRKQHLEPKIVNLNSVAVTLQKMLERLIGEDVELAVECAPGLGAVQIDVGHVEQVIMNLVVNARDAMPNGGKVTIETRNVELPTSRWWQPGLPSGQYVVLTVTDTGTGMDAETRQHLFEPFFTTKEAGKGTGLGLSTCYGIIEQSGGHVRVSSELGHGTTFEVYLPRVEAEHAKTFSAAESETPRGSETIRLVEDDTQVRTAVGRLLRHHGYGLLSAANADDAVALAERHMGEIDLVLSDVVMPGENGAQVVAKVRAHATNVPALLMSGHIEHAALERAGFSAHQLVEKPFLPEALMRKVRQALDA